MHCMQEGLGKNIVDLATSVFKKAGKYIKYITKSVIFFVMLIRFTSQRQRILQSPQRAHKRHQSVTAEHDTWPRKPYFSQGKRRSRRINPGGHEYIMFSVT